MGERSVAGKGTRSVAHGAGIAPPSLPRNFRASGFPLVADRPRAASGISDNVLDWRLLCENEADLKTMGYKEEKKR